MLTWSYPTGNHFPYFTAERLSPTEVNSEFPKVTSHWLIEAGSQLRFGDLHSHDLNAGWGTLSNVRDQCLHLVPVSNTARSYKGVLFMKLEKIVLKCDSIKKKTILLGSRGTGASLLVIWISLLFGKSMDLSRSQYNRGNTICF